MRMVEDKITLLSQCPSVIVACIFYPEIKIVAATTTTIGSWGARAQKM